MTISTPALDGREEVIRPEDALELLGLGPELEGPLVSFKLCMVPEKVRMHAANVVCAQLAKIGGWDVFELAVEVKRRALFPSDNTYRVSREAWERVMGDG